MLQIYLQTNMEVNSDDRPFVCPICKWRFKQLHNMKRHLLTHSGAKPFSCDFCDKSYTDNYSLKQHVATVHEKVLAFKCGTCGCCFGKKSNLTRHIFSVHEKVRHECHCGATFTEKSNLRRHEASVHRGKVVVQSKEKRHICATCQTDGVDKRFIRPSELRRHVKVQHKEVFEAQQREYVANHPNVCKLPKCRKRFRTKVEKCRHQRKLH